MKRIFTSLLPVCMGLASFGAAAVEPVIDGASSNTDIVVNSTTFESIGAANTVTIPAGSTFECAVTCTATAINPQDPNSDAEYRFSIDDTATGSTNSCTRRLDFNERTSNDDLDKASVATTCLLSVTGTKTLYCTAAKDDAGQLNLTVDNVSSTVVCVDDPT